MTNFILTFIRVSPMIREFVQSVDDREWQSSLFSLLQSQTYNQCEVDLFELMCKVLDQNLFSQVDWARNTIFFKDLKVSQLLQHNATNQYNAMVKKKFYLLTLSNFNFSSCRIFFIWFFHCRLMTR